MNKKFLNVVKWIFIILGVLFLLQIILFTFVIAGINSFSKVKTTFDNKPKEMMPIINYALKFKKEHGMFPKGLEGVKLKKDLKYNYEITNDQNCFRIVVEDKKTVKQYQYCTVDTNNSNASSESYSEYKR